ncbi:hypothetical protein DRO57_02780 [Candidatus Bathyarchaeota archaeon]|nr:MAG: hypothetical protein DRO57_02780 [Candidatus Bathyarchaeota archaeon]
MINIDFSRMKVVEITKGRDITSGNLSWKKPRGEEGAETTLHRHRNINGSNIRGGVKSLYKGFKDAF